MTDKTKRIDRRTLYTQNVIKEALLKLLKTRDFTDIPISELCREADINRGTFYLHYKNTDMVLDDLFFDALGSTHSMLIQIGCEASESLDKGYPLCRFIRENPKYQPLFFSDSLRSKVIGKIADANLESFLSQMREKTDLEENVLISLFYFQINGCLAISKKEISSDDSAWSITQCNIDRFLKGGFDSISR